MTEHSYSYILEGHNLLITHHTDKVSHGMNINLQDCNIDWLKCLVNDLNAYIEKQQTNN